MAGEMIELHPFKWETHNDEIHCYGKTRIDESTGLSTTLLLRILDYPYTVTVEPPTMVGDEYIDWGDENAIGSLYMAIGKSLCDKGDNHLPSCIHRNDRKKLFYYAEESFIMYDIEFATEDSYRHFINRSRYPYKIIHNGNSLDVKISIHSNEITRCTNDMNTGT